ncbi:MAG: glycosyltransferase family 4 protein [Nitrospirae bacterium]|nr:glycosyltransferase family 4 protein [Nitrospirota bacterium]
MTVLHINKFHYLRGGSEVVYFQTARLLEAHGHRSVFFSMHHPESLPCETSDYFVPYIDLNKKMGVTGQIKVAGRILYYLKAKRLLSELLDRYRVDIAHLHNIHHQISPSILHVFKKRKIPVVMTLHDLKMACASYLMLVDGKPCEACKGGKYSAVIKQRCVKESFIKSVLAALEMYLHHKILDIYNNVNVFISPSLFLKNKLEEMGFKKKVVHLPNFINMGNFNDVIKSEVKHDNSIVYFGRLSPEKGLWTLLEAAKRLQVFGKAKVEIKIIGDGELREKLQEKVRAERINNVRFLGYMKGESLYQEIKKSLFVVFPSECYENNPISVLEAFVLGRPVIGARTGGIPELVGDDETGLTFEPGDSDELSLKIEYLINNPDKAVEMGKNAGRFVEQELNAEKYYQGLMKIYRQAATKN